MTSVERQVRVLMRAWPIPDRVERGNEIVGTSLDLVPDGRNWLPLALATNLVVGGIRARWRMRPPPWRWIVYRMGGRLSTRWHRWMLNDLKGPGWRRRMVVSRLLFSLVFISTWAVVSGVTHRPGMNPLSFVIGFGLAVIPAAVIGAILAGKQRNRQLDRYGYLQSAQQLPSEPSLSQ